MKLFNTFVLALLLIFLWQGCTKPTTKIVEEPPSLKSAFQDAFHIGTALSADHINKTDTIVTALIEREFNSITPENMMKWMYIHPAQDTFDFEMADKFIALGEQNNMFTLAHALVWHSQLAPFVETIQDKAAMTTMLEKHITTIVSRYKGRINAWDVVNEALNEDGTLRESIFLKVMGKDYLKQSFAWAATADSTADFYYNDYNICQPAKRKGAIALIKDIQDSGIKIDGVGIQAHWSLLGPSLKEIEASILEYSELGIKVMFTELDITVLPNPWDLVGAEVSQNYEGSPFMNPYPETLPDSMQTKLADRYEEIFRLFLKHQDKISRVTFWGVHDGHSWLNGWPIKNRTNYPLLFDRKYQPKEAYHRVMNLIQ